MSKCDTSGWYAALFIAICISVGTLQSYEIGGNGSNHVYYADDVPVLRGVLLGAQGHSQDAREIARAWQFLLVEYTEGFSISMETGAADKLPVYLNYLAGQLNHPEIANLPVVFWHPQKQTPDLMDKFASAMKGRVIGVAHFFGTLRYVNKVAWKPIPKLDIEEEGLATTIRDFTRAQDNLFTGAVMWNFGHGLYSKVETYWWFFDSMIRQCLPHDHNPRNGAPALREAKIADGWFGDLSQWSEYPYIAPVGEYNKDKSKATWIPNKRFAHIWRAYMSKAPQIAVVSPVWSYRQAGIRSGIGYGMSFKPNEPFDISISVQYTSIDKVEFFDGDIPIGEAKEAPYTLKGARLGPGYHAIIAIAVLKDGGRKCSRPAPMIVEGDMYGVPMQSTGIALGNADFALHKPAQPRHVLSLSCCNQQPGLTVSSTVFLVNGRRMQGWMSSMAPNAHSIVQIRR